MGTHLRVLSKSYPMNTNMTGSRWFFKDPCVLVLSIKVTLALEELQEKYVVTFFEVDLSVVVSGVLCCHLEEALDIHE